MKTKKVGIISLILAVFIALFTVGYTFAWFTSSYSLYFGGRAGGAYFAGGNGSAEDPYEIETIDHLYNLAWLQDTGKLDNKDKNGNKIIYHFELIGDITVGNFVLPPIGTKEFPFNGVFNGNGHKITDLKVSTNNKILTNKPNKAGEENTIYAFSNSVGMFGLTAPDTSDIKNFILETPTVEVAEEKDGACYAPITEGETADKKAAGLAIGYVAHNASSIGVIGGTLSVRRAGYTTVNSILGAYDEENLNADITGDDGAGFGGSFDLEKYAKRLNLISKKNTNNKLLPIVTYNATSSSIINSDGVDTENYGYLPLQILNGLDDIDATTGENIYKGANFQEKVSPNNIGYLIGNQLKLYSHTIPFTDEYKTPKEKLTEDPYKGEKVPMALYTREIIKINEGTTGEGTTKVITRPMTEGEIKDLPQSIQDIIPKTLPEEPVERKMIRMQGTPNTGNIVLNNTTFTIGDKKYTKSITVAGKEYTKAEIPGQCIWFKPASAGIIRFVIYARPSEGYNFTFSKVKRAGNTPGELGGTLTVENIESALTTGIETGRLFYYEYDCTKDFNKASGNEAEYALANGEGKGVQFLYLDIGANGSQQPDNEKNIKGIDFIYDGVTITQKALTGIDQYSFIYVDNNNTISYTETNAKVSFTDATTTDANGAVVTLAFSRLEKSTTSDGKIVYGTYTDGKTLKVVYYKVETCTLASKATVNMTANSNAPAAMIGDGTIVWPQASS